MRTMTRIIIALLAIATFLPGMVGCKATAESAETGLIWTQRPERLQPASAGQNKVWVDFQDITGSGVDLYDHIVDGVIARGYDLADEFETADYVVWATLRFFGPNPEGDGGAKRAAELGGIAGGLGAAEVARRAGAGALGTAAVGIGAGAATMVAIEWATMQREYAAILDLQLAEKIEGGVDDQIRRTSGTEATGVVGVAAGRGGDEYGTTTDTSSGQQAITRRVPHLRSENRLSAYSRGTRLDQNTAKAAIMPKISEGLSQIMPRAARAR